MAVVTRPYFLIMNGIERMVEAANPAAAVRHVVGAAVTELRPARGSEVMKWVLADKAIETAGQRDAAAPTARDAQGQISEDPVFLADDCVDWLRDQKANATGLKIFGKVRSSQRMTLEQFDKLRVDCPAFGDAVLTAVRGDDRTITIDELRDQLQDNPMSLDVVVGALADAKSREVFPEIVRDANGDVIQEDPGHPDA